MATCDKIEVDLSPKNFEVSISTSPYYSVEVVQPDITIEAVTVGNQGPKGDPGPTGPTGPTGPIGPSGAQGLPGAAATIAVGTTVTLAPGSSATVTNSGSSSSATFDFGIPAGIQGNTGATGPTGPTGPQGATGATGSQGAQGPPGPAGAGTGDMLRSVYDTNANNVVDTCDSLAWGKLTSVPSTFTPSAHASTHVTGGGDVIPAPTTSASGVVPALPATAGASKFLDGTGAFAQVAYANVTGTPTIPAPSSTTPAMDGTAAVGTGTTYARNDHIHPSDTSRLAVGAAPTAHASSHVTGGTDVIALASTSARGLLTQVSGNTTDFVDGTNTCQNLATAVQPVIWSATRRVFNAISNPTFEVDQRNVGAALTNPGGIFLLDRYTLVKTAVTLAGNWAQTTTAVVVPGTSFAITRSFLRFTLTTQQASLAGGDLYGIVQVPEGPRWRELISDVSSISLLVRSSVGPIKFACSLRDASGPPVLSLTNLCTIPTANTWILITLPNIPKPSGGSFGLFPGQAGYSLGIHLCCGATTYMSPTNGVWNSGNFLGAPGMDNFAGIAPVNSTFDIAFIQHEPGALCTTPIDCPFQQNYDDCLRYYQKTYDYGTAVGTVTSSPGVMGFVAPGAIAVAFGTMKFHKPMAKTPTVTLYNWNTGAANSVYDYGGISHASATASNVNSTGFSGISFTTAVTGAMGVYAHYTSDTGW